MEEKTSQNFTDKEFETLGLQAETTYASIGQIQCPYLESKVLFNALGLDHLKFKRWNHARSKSDQFMRLKLLHLAPNLLKKSHTLQGIDRGNRLERVKARGKWQVKMCHVSFYDFIGVINGCRIRVVVKKVDNGPCYFWSIIPYWKQAGTRRTMFEGNPEID